VVFASLLSLLLLAYPLLALLKGELLPGQGHVSLFGGIEFQLTRPSSGSLFDADSGARGLLDFWHSLDPFVLIMVMVGIPYALAVRRLWPVGLALAIPVVVALRPGGYLPAMYVIALFPFAAVAVAGMADSLARLSVPLTFPRFEGIARGRFASANGRSIVGLAALIAVFSLVVAIAGPRWASGTYAQMTDDDSAAFRQAVHKRGPRQHNPRRRHVLARPRRRRLSVGARRLVLQVRPRSSGTRTLPQRLA
jgi:hypothetical protein